VAKATFRNPLSPIGTPVKLNDCPAVNGIATLRIAVAFNVQSVNMNTVALLLLAAVTVMDGESIVGEISGTPAP
jgi:hypothetical protein